MIKNRNGHVELKHPVQNNRISAGEMAASPQQFCLRWNNHQSNIISVFEQLLQSEAFVDVTLAVEGMSLKAHKVVLSACSPYFQAILASHPDKHPIVILKDVRYGDMRDLLDFMYRGEVSVDQENLSGFLKVAESLRIKGLTEVNEKKRMENSTSPYLMHHVSTLASGIPTIPISTVGDVTTLKRPTPSPTNQYNSNKRRRGRPPKISGDESEGETNHASSGANSTISAIDSEESKADSEMRKIKIEAEEFKENFNEEAKSNEARATQSAGPSGEIIVKDEPKSHKDDCDTRESPGSAGIEKIPIPRLLAIPVMRPKRPRGRPPRLPRIPQDSSKWLPLLPKPAAKSLKSTEVPLSSTDIVIPGNSTLSSFPSTSKLFLKPAVSVFPNPVSMPSMEISSSNLSNPTQPVPFEVRDFSNLGLPGGVLPLSVELGISEEVGDNSSSSNMPCIQDMADGVQMGIKVRGLDLMRYGRLENGIFKCIECEKIHIMKTFKTSYSFQRHAYLYHEGSPKRFPCPHCGKEFSRPDKRKSHLKEKHGLFSVDKSDQFLENLE